MSDHRELLIVKGVAKAVIGTSTSAEQGLTSISLLAESGRAGFALNAENGWSPQRPTLKGGGVWMDSAISDGRALIAGARGNVMETMHLTLTADTVLDLSRHLSAMEVMIEDCLRFGDSHWQIEPVYLRWWAAGAPGPQFALILFLDMAIDEPDVWSAPLRDVVLTIEREPYWRPIPPGANPKLWTAEFHGDNILVADDLWIAPRNLTAANIRNNLQTITRQNRREWNVGQTGLLSQNYLDIPAASIPGDAPALVIFSFDDLDGGTGGLETSEANLLVSRQTTDPTLPGRNGVNNQSVYLLNAGDCAQLGTDASIQADTGAPASNNQATGQRGRVTFATVTVMTSRFTWRAQGSSTPETRVDMSLDRGMYAVLARVRLSAVGTVEMQLQYGLGDVANAITNAKNRVTDQGLTGTGNSTQWQLVYLGEIAVPVDASRVSVGADGQGVLVLPSNTARQNLTLILQAARTSGTPELYVADLFLQKIDEAALALHFTSSGFLGATNALIYDGSGYFLHGQIGDYAAFWRVDGSENAEDENAEQRGASLTLRPGVDNRLHFLHCSGSDPLVSTVTASFRVCINVLPRWVGIRDI